MKQVSRGGLTLWEFENLGTENDLHHFVTERNTNPGGHPFTLSYSSTPDRGLVNQNRRLIANAMGVAETALFLPSQVHKTRIVHVAPGTLKEELMETDALITSHRGLCIAVMSADCVPILLWDKQNKVVAAVHAGWRGTVAKILQKTLEEMKATFNTQGIDIMAGVGPSVSEVSYEVGNEVIDAVTNAFGRSSNLLIHLAEGKARLDLWKANILQLVAFGVPESNIEVSNLCTVVNNQYFFSARKGDSGRFAAGIVMA